MIKGKKGTAAIYLFMLFIVFVVLGLSLGNPLTQSIGESKNSSEINCSNVSDSDYQNRAVCTQLDTFPFFYVGLIFGLGFIIIKTLGR